MTSFYSALIGSKKEIEGEIEGEIRQSKTLSKDKQSIVKMSMAKMLEAPDMTSNGCVLSIFQVMMHVAMPLTVMATALWTVKPTVHMTHLETSWALIHLHQAS